MTHAAWKGNWNALQTGKHYLCSGGRVSGRSGRYGCKIPFMVRLLKEDILCGSCMLHGERRLCGLYGW